MMVIYVDQLVACIPNRNWKWKESCHLFTLGDVEDLHRFASSIGLKRAWFQGRRSPHYDLNAQRRKAAIQAGAVVADRAIQRKWIGMEAE